MNWNIAPVLIREIRPYHQWGGDHLTEMPLKADQHRSAPLREI
jgi:hypothetical protein